MDANPTPAAVAASRTSAPVLSERRDLARDHARGRAQHDRVATVVRERDRVLERDRALAEAVGAVDHGERNAQLAAGGEVVGARAPDDLVRAVVEGGRRLEAEAGRHT